MAALLTYRPPSVSALAAVLSFEAKKRLRERYLGDLLWMCAKAQYRDFQAPAFGEYCQSLEPRHEDRRTGREIVSSLADTLRARIRKRGGTHGGFNPVG